MQYAAAMGLSGRILAADRILHITEQFLRIHQKPGSISTAHIDHQGRCYPCHLHDQSELLPSASWELQLAPEGRTWVPQIEVFHELHAATIEAAKGGQACLRGSIFETPEERLLMMAVILHTADIANAAKPWHIAER